MGAERGIDHLVIAVNDLSSASDRFSRFGFTTTPLGRHPWGTANHLVQFPGNFIELLGVVDAQALVPMSATHFSFGAHNARFLERREGLSMLVLSTEDARADARIWRERGLNVYEPVHWSRKATLPDGRESTVAFTLTFVVDPDMPEIAFFSCQQHNPEFFWKPEYQKHENSARMVAGVTLVSDQPARHRDFFAALIGGAAIDEDSDALCIETALGDIRVLSPRRFASRYRDARLGGDINGAVPMAATIAVADLDRAARCLEASGAACTRTDEAIQIAGEHCCGVLLELVPQSP